MNLEIKTRRKAFPMLVFNGMQWNASKIISCENLK